MLYLFSKLAGPPLVIHIFVFTLYII